MEIKDMHEQSTVTAIETVAQHGYAQISRLLDADRFDDARKVADILMEIGVI